MVKFLESLAYFFLTSGSIWFAFNLSEFLPDITYTDSMWILAIIYLIARFLKKALGKEE